MVVEKEKACFGECETECRIMLNAVWQKIAMELEHKNWKEHRYKRQEFRKMIAWIGGIVKWEFMDFFSSVGGGMCWCI